MDVTIEGVLVGDKLEVELAKSLTSYKLKRKKHPNNIHFDLSGINFLDCYSAQLLICYLALFDRQGYTTSLELSKRKSVRDILRVWNFDDALKAATGRRMFRYCSSESIEKYFFPHDSQTTFDLDLFPSHYQQPLNQDPDDTKPINRNFFGFRTIDVPNEVHKKPGVANLEKRFWQSHNVKSLLERDLKIDVRYFSARAIFEAVFNALRHPSAEIVQTATHTRYIYEQSQLPLPFSQTQKNRKASRKSAVVHYWDNGKSLLDLINQNLNESSKFRTESPGEYAKKYRLRWTGSEQPTPSIDKVFGCDQDAVQDSHTSEKLLFVLQPFVSMSPTLFGHSSSDETTRDNPRLASVGMGLYLLLDTAVTMFGGKVSIRTSNIRMRITKGKKSKTTDGVLFEKHDYLVDIEEMPESLPKFLGNLISISIPEQKSKPTRIDRRK